MSDVCSREFEYSHYEVVEALLELVDEGVLEMGVDEGGTAVYWFTNPGLGQERAEAVAAR